MKRISAKRFTLCFLLVACSGIFTTAKDAVPPIELNKNWQLFLDDYFIARSTGLSRVLHHPEPRGLVIPADKPWETAGTEVLYGTPIGRRADGTFYAFYRALWWDPTSSKDLGGNIQKTDRAHHMRQSVGYATSKDGIHWEKPILNLITAPAGVRYEGPWPYPEGESKANNLGAPITDPTDLMTYGNVTDPKKRFVFRVVSAPGDPKQQAMSTVTVGEWEGFFAAEIPDFLNDPKWKDKLVSTGGGLNPRRHFVNYWDSIHEEWVALEQGVAPHWLPSREIGRYSSKDLKEWKARVALYPDSQDHHTLECYDEPMTLHPWWAEGMVFGLLSWFHGERLDPSGGPVLEPTPEHPYRWPWVRKGICDTRIVISRDGGKTWDRTVSREAFIPASTREHAYDRQTIRPMPPVRVGDEDWFYVTVMNGNHLVIRNQPNQDSFYHDRVAKLQIALYTQPHNRYVSMRARAGRPEVLISKPVILNGNNLQLNVDASHGEVRVAIASTEGQSFTYSGNIKVPLYAPHLAKPLPGFSFEDCVPIKTNHIEHTVKFSGDRSVKELAGKSVFVLVQLQDAEVFGVRCIP